MSNKRLIDADESPVLLIIRALVCEIVLHPVDVTKTESVLKYSGVLLNWRLCGEISHCFLLFLLF